MKETFGAVGTSGTPGGLPGVTPPAPAALAAKVRTLAPSMTRSMQRVAEAVAADPAGCAALTVTGLAELTGTSEATVVRTARLLGYPGYRDLRLALAGLAAQQQSGRSPAVTADIAVDDPIADVVAKLAYDEQQTLADTAAGLDMAQLSAAVGALAAARRIDIYGVGASGLVAQDLAQKLLRIGLVAHAHSDPHLAVTNAVQLRARTSPSRSRTPGRPGTSSSRCGSPSSVGPRRSRSPGGRTDPSRSTPTTYSPPPRPARASCALRPCRPGPANYWSWTACS